ncbi:hypothetical protein [Taklimakanibacter lacteus]|uniref:hypothetical protein n=1 Tax=Taklimakanibacter lacteus TaxID=2268456 RepID=UPI0013C5081E
MRSRQFMTTALIGAFLAIPSGESAKAGAEQILPVKLVKPKPTLDSEYGLDGDGAFPLPRRTGVVRRIVVDERTGSVREAK